jgi:RNA polymerase sigma-70 factor (ECF subfamily)
MFRPHRDFRRIVDTDDVVQKALIRLRRALVTVKPPNVRAFFGLAAQQVRWVLRDLAREVGEAKAIELSGGSVPDSRAHLDAAGGGAEQPADLLAWAEFHDKIEQLPDDLKAMFDALLYQGLTQPEAADLLGLSLRTVKRRWQQARLALHDALRGEWPPID